MLKLIPAVKQLNLYEGNWDRTAVMLKTKEVDERLLIALKDFESAEDGIPLEIRIGNGEPEEYRMQISEAGICITAGSEAGAFYAIQTLRQIIANGQVPYLEIQDKPDFEHRGFYHDITRGKDLCDNQGDLDNR